MRATHKKIQTSAKGWTIRKDGENGYNLCEPNDHQFLHFSSSNVVEEEKLTFSMDHFFICSHRFVSSSQTHSAQPLSSIKCGCMSMGVLYLPLWKRYLWSVSRTHVDICLSENIAAQSIFFNFGFTLCRRRSYTLNLGWMCDWQAMNSCKGWGHLKERTDEDHYTG